MKIVKCLSVMLLAQLYSCGLYNSFSGDSALLNSDNPKVVSVLLRNNCYTCHAGWGELASDREWQFGQFQLFEVGAGASSEIYTRMYGQNAVTRMPPAPNAKVSADDLEVIKEWIDNMELAIPNNWNESETFEAAFTVMQLKCNGCHSAGSSQSGGLFFVDAAMKQRQIKGNYPTEAEVLASIGATFSGAIDPDNTTTSIRAVINLPSTSANYMPRGRTLTAEQKTALETWFDAIP